MYEICSLGKEGVYPQRCVYHGGAYWDQETIKAGRKIGPANDKAATDANFESNNCYLKP